jgi:hypothetical protein
MRHRPDPADVLPWLDAPPDHPQHGLAALAARILAGDMAGSLPLVAWPLIEAVRRASVAVPPGLLARLDADLDAWERRHALAVGRGPVSVAAQAWLVQDLHCLADLHHIAGDADGASWSRRGHAAESALHAGLWGGAGYHDRDADGRPVPASLCDALMPLLLLDTPPERVATLDAQARAGLAGASAGDPAGVRLARIGLGRHGRAP